MRMSSSVNSSSRSVTVPPVLKSASWRSAARGLPVSSFFSSAPPQSVSSVGGESAKWMSRAAFHCDSSLEIRRIPANDLRRRKSLP